LPMNEAWGYIQCAKVCVSPFRPSPVLNSTSPTKVVEYLAWNRPVVVNDHPDQSKVLRESGAGIVVPYEIDPFARAIVELLKDEKKAEAMAAGGREYVRTHRSYDAIATQVEQVYADFLFGKTIRNGIPND
jgi:glycosyltransferase involved in cell wall biosynthesis